MSSFPLPKSICAQDEQLLIPFRRSPTLPLTVTQHDNTQKWHSQDSPKLHQSLTKSLLGLSCV